MMTGPKKNLTTEATASVASAVFAVRRQPWRPKPRCRVFLVLGELDMISKRDGYLKRVSIFLLSVRFRAIPNFRTIVSFSRIRVTVSVRLSVRASAVFGDKRFFIFFLIIRLAEEPNASIAVRMDVARGAMRTVIVIIVIILLRLLLS